jgi:hypothetical protein
MRLGLRHTLGLTLLMSQLAWASAAHAEQDAATRAAARKLAEDGVAALQSGDAKTAAQKLDKAFRMLMVPSVGLWSGRALIKQGLLVEGMERLLEATRLPSAGDVAVQDRARVDAEKEIEQLRPRIPNLVVVLEGANAAEVALTIDGKPVPNALVGEDMPLNPGTHRLVAKRGDQEQALDVSLAESERKPVTLRFSVGVRAAPAAPAAPLSVGGTAASASDDPGASGTIRRPLAYVTLALGGAGLAMGGVTGVIALGKRSDLDDNPNCADGKCLRSAEDDVSSLRTFRTLSTVGFIAGGVLAGAGVVLLLTSSRNAPHAWRAPSTLALELGPGDVRLKGRF